MDSTLLGAISIDGPRLGADVNSERREKKLRALVAKALGGKACYRATEIQSMERLLDEARKAGRSQALREARDEALAEFSGRS